MRSKIANTITPLQKAPMVIFNDKQFKVKGKGEEDIYFSQQERNVLRKLLVKMEKEAADTRAHAESSSDSDGEHFVPTSEKKKKEAAKAHDPSLKEIFQTHGISEDPELMKQLKNWKKK